MSLRTRILLHFIMACIAIFALYAGWTFAP